MSQQFPDCVYVLANKTLVLMQSEITVLSEIHGKRN
jgi:hypothetical protein